MRDPLTTRLGRGTAITAGLASLASLGLLAGCGGGDEVGAKPDLPTESPALWNPCDVLTVAFVKKQFGSEVTRSTGTPTAPECRFSPRDADGGEPALTSSYLLFSGTLEDAWSTMGIGDQAEVTQPEVPGSDDARVVVNATPEQLYVTGFVQNGDLIQQVDVVDPKPYTKARIVRAVEATLTLLSDHAEESDVRGKKSKLEE